MTLLCFCNRFFSRAFSDKQKKPMTTPETAEIMEKGENTMLSIEDLKKGGVDRSVLVVCGDESRYEGEYSERFGVVFFCIPREKKIVGYVLR